MKILIFDIETTPILGYAWSTWKTDLISVVEDWTMMSFAYKWYGDKSRPTFVRPDMKNPWDGKKMVEYLWNLFDEAHVVIGFNSDRFDNKKAQALFLRYGLKPPSPFKSVDLLKVSRRNFAHSSHKLDNISKLLGFGTKTHHGGFMKMFQECMKDNDPKAWKLLEKYNKQDVLLTEKLYVMLLPWISNHPLDPTKDHDGATCPSCHRTGTSQKRGLQTARTWSYQRYHCIPKKGGCGRWFKGRRALKDLKDAVDEDTQ